MKKILSYLHKIKRFSSINEISKEIGISWNTAKKDLETMCKKNYVKKVNRMEKNRYQFKF